MGGDLEGTGGTAHKNLRWGTAHASVPPIMGGDLWETAGDGLTQKCEVGDDPSIRPPNILRSTVIGCEAKYELTKKVSMKNCVF